MISQDFEPGVLCEIMDAVSNDTRSHRIEGTEYIEYNIPRASKVRYAPPSPTTSGYSESGSEMDNHDSGRASELEGSPKVPPKRPDKMTFGLDLLERIASNGSTANEFNGIQNQLRRTLPNGHTSLVSELPAGVVTVEASALNSLMYSLENTRNRLDQMERNMEALIKAITLQNQVSNEAVFKLTRTLLALGSDVKHIRDGNHVEQPSTSQLPHSRKLLNDFDSAQSSTGPKSTKLTQSSNYDSATYPRLPHSDSSVLPVSVAPPSEIHIESYDNVPVGDTAVEKIQSAVSNHKDVTMSTSFVDHHTDDVMPKPPLYAKVRKVKSAENVLSNDSCNKDMPPTLPRRSTEMLTSVKDDEVLSVEKLLNELQLPTESSKQGDDCSCAESLTRISRFSDVESLMSAFDNEENNLFSEGEFDTDDSSEHDFDNFDTPRENTTISPDQGISSAADLSQSNDTHCTASTNDITQHSQTLLDKNAEEYSSSIIIPSKSSLSVCESEVSQNRESKTSPSHGRKANALFANYKKIFKRKKKRAESQTSFTFVTSPLYEKELQQNPPKPNKKLIKGLSVDSIISSKKLNASNLSLVSSTHGDNADSRSSNSKLNTSPCKGSPRALNHQSMGNTQLLRLQSRETLPGDDATPEDFLVVTENIESYDNFVTNKHNNENSNNMAEYKVQRIPNGNILHEKFDNSRPTSQSPRRSKLMTASRDESFQDSVLHPNGYNIYYGAFNIRNFACRPVRT